MAISSLSRGICRTPVSNAICCLVPFTLILILVSPPDRMLGWDEVDYIVAARHGLFANALDITSLPLSHFLALAFAKAQGLPPAPIPSGYNEAVDLFHLRHFHPPLLQYLGSFHSLVPADNVRLSTRLAFGLRWFCGASLIFAAQIICHAVFGRLQHSLSRFLQAAILLNAAWILSNAVQYHVLIAISLLLVAFCITYSLQCSSRSSWFLLSASLAFAILSLETSIVILAVSFAIAISHGLLRTPHQWPQTLQRALLHILLLPLGISFLLWPASLSKLSLVRTILMHVYRIFWVKEEYASVFSLASLQGLLIILAPLGLIALISLGLSLSIVLCKPRFYIHSYYLPLTVFSLIGLSYTAFMVPFVLNTTYMVPGLLLLCLPLPHLLDGLAISGKILSFVLTSLLVVSSAYSLKHHDSTTATSYPGWSALPTLNGLLQATSGGVQQPLTIYADGGHILRFYLPDHSSRIIDIPRINHSNDIKKVTRLFSRQNLTYVELQADHLQKPAMLILREHNASALPYLPFPCHPTIVPGLEGSVACLIP